MPVDAGAHGPALQLALPRRVNPPLDGRSHRRSGTGQHTECGADRLLPGAQAEDQVGDRRSAQKRSAAPPGLPSRQLPTGPRTA